MVPTKARKKCVFTFNKIAITLIKEQGGTGDDGEPFCKSRCASGCTRQCWRHHNPELFKEMHAPHNKFSREK
jgi:hypothetical protein